MNSKLKKLEELEKLIPEWPCGHPQFMMRYDEATAREVERITQEMESCPRCQKDGAKLLVIVLYSGAPWPERPPKVQ